MDFVTYAISLNSSFETVNFYMLVLNGKYIFKKGNGILKPN